MTGRVEAVFTASEVSVLELVLYFMLCGNSGEGTIILQEQFLFFVLSGRGGKEGEKEGRSPCGWPPLQGNSCEPQRLVGGLGFRSYIDAAAFTVEEHAAVHQGEDGVVTAHAHSLARGATWCRAGG